MKVLCLIISIVTGISALASGRVVGNGGDVLVCPNSVKLLDFYEAQTLRGMQIDLGGESHSLPQKIEMALNRLSRLSPKRAEIYHQWAKTFFAETQFLSGIQLIDIPDSQHIVLPKGCQISQVANQASHVLPGQKRYTIDNDIWMQLNSDEQAGLVLHEIIYREAIAAGHLNSASVRWLTSVIASPVMDQLTLQQFLELMSFLNFQTVSVQGAHLELFKLSKNQKTPNELFYHPNGVLRYGELVEGSVLVAYGRAYQVRGPIRFSETGQIQSFFLWRGHQLELGPYKVNVAPQMIQFYPSGQFQSLILQTPVEMISPGLQMEAQNFLVFHENGRLYETYAKWGEWRSPYGLWTFYDKIYFWESGVPRLVTVDKVQASLNGVRVQFRGNIHLDSNGLIQKARLAYSTRLLTTEGIVKDFAAGERLIFDAAGRVVIKK